MRWQPGCQRQERRRCSLCPGVAGRSGLGSLVSGPAGPLCRPRAGAEPSTGTALGGWVRHRSRRRSHNSTLLYLISFTRAGAVEKPLRFHQPY